MADKFKPADGGPLLNNMLNNMLQQYACSQAMKDHLRTLAALHPDCDVRIVNGDEIMLIAKNENLDLKTIGERIHEAAEGRINALAAQEQRELQRWQTWAAGWKPGVQGLFDMAQNARALSVHDFYVWPLQESRLVKTKKGPRRYRVQMVWSNRTVDF